MASIDNIVSGKVITWSYFTAACIEALKNVCCNIGSSVSSEVPATLRSGSGQVNVKTITTTVGGGGTAVTHRWYANPVNLIGAVGESTVNNEWSTFLSSAGITARSNKVIQARELGLAVGLFQQFLAFHVKRVYSRRQVYNTWQAQDTYKGSKYVTGTCTPKYTLTAIDQSNIPTITNDDITKVINQAIYWKMDNGTVKNWGMLDNKNDVNDPSISRCYLS